MLHQELFFKSTEINENLEAVLAFIANSNR